MNKPLLLDLCCCGGLASIGYVQAGFDVVGVDINHQPNYPYTFIQANALDIIADLNFLRQFDAIHASPPCQKASRSTAPQRAAGKVYADIIAPVRDALAACGLPYVIENVPEAPIRADIVLHGYNFGLKVLRRRHFELGNWFTLTPGGLGARSGTVVAGDYCTIYGKQGYRKSRKCAPGWRPKFDQGSGMATWHYAMGVPPDFKYLDVELSEGIPPAFTRFIGGLLLDHLRSQNH